MDIAGHIQISANRIPKLFETPCTVPSNLEEASKDVTHELVLQESLGDYSNYPIYNGTLAGNPVVAKIAFDDTIHAEDLRIEAKHNAL